MQLIDYNPLYITSSFIIKGVLHPIPWLFQSTINRSSYKVVVNMCRAAWGTWRRNIIYLQKFLLDEKVHTIVKHYKKCNCVNCYKIVKIYEDDKLLSWCLSDYDSVSPLRNELYFSKLRWFKELSRTAKVLIVCNLSTETHFKICELLH